jgi:hypothetical protein
VRAISTDTGTIGTGAGTTGTNKPAGTVDYDSSKNSNNNVEFHGRWEDAVIMEQLEQLELEQQQKRSPPHRQLQQGGARRKRKRSTRRMRTQVQAQVHCKVSTANVRRLRIYTGSDMGVGAAKGASADRSFLSDYYQGLNYSAFATPASASSSATNSAQGTANNNINKINSSNSHHLHDAKHGYTAAGGGLYSGRYSVKLAIDGINIELPLPLPLPLPMPLPANTAAAARESGTSELCVNNV